MGPTMRRNIVERREIALASGQNDKRIAHAASLSSLAATALESAAADLSAAHGGDQRPLAGLTELVLEEAARISRLAGDIESHRRLPASPPDPRLVTPYTSVMG